MHIRQIAPVLSTLQTRLLIVLLALLAGCSTAPPSGVSVVSPFDLKRYEGKWYEIARLDHSFERGLTDVHATYRAKDDGSVEVINRGYDPKRGAWREALGRAVFIGDPQQASLKVSFFGPFYGGYHVIALDPNYRWAMVIGPDRDYLWILARDRQLPDDVRVRLLQQATTIGIDPAKLIWVSQTRSDS